MSHQPTQSEMKEDSGKLLADTGKISGAQGFGYLLNLVGGLFIARILGKELYGIWKAVQLTLEYLVYSNLGANHGIDRLVPSLVAKKKLKQYQQLISASLSFSVLIAGVFGFVFLILSFFLTGPTQVAFLSLSVLVMIQPFFTHGDSALGAEKKFGRKAAIFFLHTAFRVLVGIAAALLLGLTGVLIVYVITMGGAAYYMLSSLSVRTRLKLDFRRVRQLIMAGGSITGLIVAERFLMGADKLIVLGLMGAEDFGVYSMALFPLPILLLVPFALRQTVQTEIYDKIDQTNRLEDCWPVFRKSVLLISLFSPFAMGAVFLGMPMLIHLFLDDYAAAIPVVQIFGLTSFSLLIIQTSFAVIVAAKKGRQMIWRFCLLVMSVSIPTLIIGVGTRNIELVLLAQSFGWLVISCWLLACVLSWFRITGRMQFRQILIWFLPFLVTTIELIVLHSLMVSWGWEAYGLAYGILGGVLHTAFCLVFFVILEKQTGALSTLASRLGVKLKVGKS